jgi:arabinosyltransferase C
VTAAGNHRTARLIAIVAGLLGAALAIATPLLPVTQTTAQLNWPQNGVLQSVNAPLIGYVATDLNITVPCSAAAGLMGPQNQGKTVLLSTVPKQAPKAVDRGLLIERVSNDLLVIVRNTPVVSAAEAGAQPGVPPSPSPHADKVTGEFVGREGTVPTPRPPLRGERVADRPNRRCLHGLSGPAPPGRRFRYSGSPTLLKMLAMIIGVAMTVIALGALHVLDTADGRRVKRFLPRRWWSVGPLDGLVIAVLVWWHFVGANTSDDGYILTMARVSEHAGYMANYYRWFGTPEAPFGWYYDLLALWAHVSTNSAWVRLPTLVMALACWWLISREVIPRLGHAVKTTPAAAWTAAGIFLAFWLPLNNGLRPEPIIALGILLTWCSGGTRCGHQRAAAGGHRDHHRPLTLFSGPPASRRSVPSLLLSVTENHCGRACFAIRLPRAAGTNPGRLHGDDHLDLPRPDADR